MRHTIFASLAVLALACNAEEPPAEHDPRAAEGDDAEECRDGADNDGDGLFDCDDDGCLGSPDCGPGGPGTTTTSSTGDCNADYCDLQSFHIDYQLDITMGAAFEGTGGICPCRLTYEADGVVDAVDASQGIVSFEGTWELTNGPIPPNDCGALETCACPPPDEPCAWGMADGVWWDDPDGFAYNTFRWDNSGGTLMDWTAHLVDGAYEPAEPGTEPQYYITNIGESWPTGESAPSLTYTLTDQPSSLALFGLEVHHSWTVQFERTP